MKAEQTVRVRLGVLQSKLDDLMTQKEENSSKGNWTVVNAIKQQIAQEQIRKKVLEWVLDDEQE